MMALWQQHRLLSHCKRFIRCAINRRQVFTSSTLLASHNDDLYSDQGYSDPDPKSGYCRNPGEVEINWENYKEAVSSFWDECKKMKGEFVEMVESDKVNEVRHGEIIKVFTFDEESIKEWFCTSDSDHGEGFSKAKVELNSQGHAVFSGVLSTEVPKDGRVFRAGYCNVARPADLQSFHRLGYYEWGQYTHLVLKVRGDGRPFMVNLGTQGFFDLTWFDMFNYCLHTRGGPYWQLVKIPFSKFIFTAKGRIQDKQAPPPLNKITQFGITLCDQVNGPFMLEIQYIGLLSDYSHHEEHAYEMYKTDPYIADL